MTLQKEINKNKIKDLDRGKEGYLDETVSVGKRLRGWGVKVSSGTLYR